MSRIVIFLLLFFTSIFASQPKFLSPEEAFKPSITLNENMQIEVNIKIAQDIYLYEEAIKLEVLKNSDISITDISYPNSVDHDGDKVYDSSPSFLITLNNLTNSTSIKQIEFKLSYQGCSALGLCYDPQTISYKLDIDTSKLSSSSTKPQKKDLEETKPTPTQNLSQTDEIASKIATGSILLTMLTFLGFGLLLALTPCTFPMIPIISGIIISQGEGLSTKKAFFLSLTYVLAMAVAYTIAGVLAGLFGSNLQASLQNPIAIYSFAAIFVALAMSMFGFYELKLPDSFVSKISSSNNSRGGYLGVAIMGFLSALIVGPCVAAPLAGALVYIGQSGDALLGGAALFAMSLGMGVPLVVVGVSAGKFMPKPGAWMTLVTAIFGVMMLAVAIWMLSRVVDGYVTMLLSAILGVGFAIYLGAFESGLHIFRKSVAVLIFIYSTTLFIGTMGGSTNLLKPLDFMGGAKVISNTSSEVKFAKATSIEELDRLLEANKGKKVLLDFSASWCASCKELDEKTFSNSSVQAKMAQFVLIRADISQNSATQKALSKKYGVFGPPVILFIDENSKVLESKRVVGFIEPDEFIKILDSI